MHQNVGKRCVFFSRNKNDNIPDFTRGISSSYFLFFQALVDLLAFTCIEEHNACIHKAGAKGANIVPHAIGLEERKHYNERHQIVDDANDSCNDDM